MLIIDCKQNSMLLQMYNKNRETMVKAIFYNFA